MILKARKVLFMSAKKPLTCQSRKVDIVIRKNKEIPIEKIKAYCQKEFERYAFIEHKNDTKPNGEIEGVHYHICGDMFGSKIAFSTRLNTLCEFFGFDNANGIEIDQYRTFEGALQYLTHKNFPEKIPHDKKEIYHNLSKEDFNIFYNADIGNVITFDLIFAACINAANIIDVIKELGISNYRMYRAVVWDIWRTLQKDEQYINRL